MNLKKNLTLIVMLLFNIALFAQDSYVLSGTITDEANVPIPGVNVIVANTTRGTSADFDGNYSIEVSDGDVLQFSSLGFTSQSITINGQQTLNVTLAEDSALLDEVVVVGYGTQKRSNLTGAVAKVGGDEVAAIQANRVDDALAGKLAGVLIQNQSGEPGADPKIQIRAASSISGDSNPLIVVDGYPISGSLATVTPNDIQSLEVLKDAASAAIYGSRGANGVILVTTKKGKQGKASFSYNAYTSISNKYQRDNLLLNASEWADTIEANIANGSFDVSEVDPALLNYRINAYRNSPGAISPEEWLFQTGTSTNHDFSVSGGSEDVNYFASLGYLNTKGIARTQGFERINARMNVDAKLGNKFQTGLSFNGFTSNREILAHDQRDLLRAYGVHPVYHTEESIAFVQDLNNQAIALGLAPFDDGYRGGDAPFNNSIFTLQPGDTAQDWHYGRSGNGIGGSGDAGPATKLDNQRRTQRTYFANVSSYLQYSIFDGLNIKTVLGADIRDTKDFYYRGLEADSRARTNQTNLDETDIKRTSVLSETTLNFAKVIGKHDISAVVGLEFQDNKIIAIAVEGNNVPFGDIQNYNLFDPADIVVTERDETVSRRSVFGRVTYAFDDRYLLSASLRRDGDSRFGANNRFETFPALSVGWNIHNESFLKDNEGLSRLKLRFSTGSLGTTSFLGSYDALSLLNPSPTVIGNGFLISDNIANPDLTWQTNTETNYGADLGFFNNRLTIGVDYYTSNVENILLGKSVSEVLGTTDVTINAGDIESSGLELELGGLLVQKQDFTWNMNANLSTVNTEIKDLDGLDELPPTIYGQSGRGPEFRNRVGGEIGEMWGLETIRQVESVHIADPTRTLGADSGEYYVVDQNGDGEINRDDYVKIGQNTPDFYYGLSSQMRYKDFDMSFQFQGTQGAEVFNIDPLYWQSQFGGRLRDSFDANDDGIADATGEFYTRARDQTDSPIQDASYLALRNLTVGYTFASDLTSKAGINSARLYVAATNLLYIWGDDYTSFNPEGIETTNGGYLGPTTSGVQVGASPVVRSFTLGLNVNF